MGYRLTGLGKVLTRSVDDTEEYIIPEDIPYTNCTTYSRTVTEITQHGMVKKVKIIFFLAGE